MAVTKRAATPDRVCGNCDHWEPIPDSARDNEGEPSGECYARPPTVHVSDDGYVEDTLPITFASRRRCGLFVLKTH